MQKLEYRAFVDVKSKGRSLTALECEKENKSEKLHRGEQPKIPVVASASNFTAKKVEKKQTDQNLPSNIEEVCESKLSFQVCISHYKCPIILLDQRILGTRGP